VPRFRQWSDLTPLVRIPTSVPETKYRVEKELDISCPGVQEAR